jgi:acetyltransferase-like isoleucine patch superfamily enzyme
VKVGNGCLIGTGACILKNRSISDRVIEGGGAVVIKDISAGLTVEGIPAKPLVK